MMMAFSMGVAIDDFLFLFPLPLLLQLVRRVFFCFSSYDVRDANPEHEHDNIFVIDPICKYSSEEGRI